jgi:hypothetical protein
VAVDGASWTRRANNRTEAIGGAHPRLYDISTRGLAIRNKKRKGKHDMRSTLIDIGYISKIYCPDPHTSAIYP